MLRTAKHEEFHLVMEQLARQLGVREEGFVDGCLKCLGLRWSDRKAGLLYKHLKRIEREKLREGDVFSPRPPAEELDGDYRYAVSVRQAIREYCTTTEVLPVGCSRRQLNGGFGLWGLRRRGKTSCIYSILDPLIREGLSVVVTDFKKDYRGLLDYHMNVQIFRIEDPLYYQNPFETILPATVDDTINGFISNVCSQFQLLQGSLGFHSREITMFFHMLDDPVNNPPSLRQYISFLDHRNLQGDDNQFRTRFMRVAGGLIARTNGSLDCSKGIPLSKICRPGQVTVIELDGLLGSHAAFLATDIHLKLFNRRKALADRGADDGQVILVADECKNLYPAAKERMPEEGIPLLYKLFCEAAEFGMGGNVLADQSRSIISRLVTDNLLIHICFRLGNEELKWLGSSKRFTKEQLDHIANQEVGQAVVVSEFGMEPIIIPDTFAHRNPVSETKRIRHMKPIYEELMADVRPPIKLPKKFWIEIETKSLELPDTQKLFLELVYANPYDVESELFAKSEIHPSSAHRMVEKMVKGRLLNKVPISTGRRGGNIVLLRLTQTGLQAIGKMPLAEGGNESIEHRFWKERICRKLIAAGMECEIEASLGDSCRVDVLVRKAGQPMGAVEVCLSERHVKENIIGDLAGCPKVLLACRTKTLTEKIERIVKREIPEELIPRIEFRTLSQYLE